MNFIKTNQTCLFKGCSFILILLLILISEPLFSQGFLHRNGKYLYDGNGNEVILRGIGTGNWLLQEGYMIDRKSVV